MKVLVTGATGFVGSHLTETLVGAGYELRVLARPTSDMSVFKNLDVEIVQGDITDAAAVERAVSGCRHVYHLAAKTSHTRVSQNQYYLVNVKGTDIVARAAVKANVDRLIYCSSGGVYGTITSPPVDEKTKPNPNSLYSESKLLGEDVALDYQKKHGLPIVIARITSVFGPRSVTNWLGLVKAINTKGFRIIGTGDNHFHVGYISDIVDGIRRCGEVQGIEGECYLIAGKEPVKVKQLVAMIAHELGISDPHARLPAGPFRVFSSLSEAMFRRFGVEVPPGQRYRLFLTDNVFDISKAQKELGYYPRVSTREGIQQMVKWYREQGYL
jgi:nucleoside-diphosphate-sugar epimerase